MPTLTAVARAAVQFDAAYAVYPESIKGLFSVLCSRHPAMDVTADVLAQSVCTPLPAVLAAHGYQTALFHSGRFGYLGMQAILDRQRFQTAEDAGAISGQIESSFGVDEPSTVARVLSWIDRRDRQRPFFVSYMPIAGHHPYDTPVRGPFAGEGALSAYENSLRYGDESIAVLLDGLRARGLDRDTLVVVFGDHGEAFGQHDGNVGHTFFAFDENVRVPLLFSLPGVTAAAVRSSRVASLVDIAPTILSLLDITAPSSFAGSSLLAGDDEMAFFFTDYALGWAGLRDACWKYLLEVEANRSQLFDVCRDPDERQDVSAGHSARVKAYRDRTLSWVAATRSSYVGK
jgi:arylsulfatase A-like enzyme